jgi:hypothetical protein
MARQKVQYDPTLEALTLVFEVPPAGAPGGKRAIHGEACPACGYVELHTTPWLPTSE